MLWPKDFCQMKMWLIQGYCLWIHQTEPFSPMSGGQKTRNPPIFQGTRRMGWRWAKPQTQATLGSRMKYRLRDCVRQNLYRVLRIFTTKDGGRILIIHVFWRNGYCRTVLPSLRWVVMVRGVSWVSTSISRIWGWINVMRQSPVTITIISDRNGCWYMKWKLRKPPTTLKLSMVPTSVIGQCRWVKCNIWQEIGFRWGWKL